MLWSNTFPAPRLKGLMTEQVKNGLADMSKSGIPLPWGVSLIALILAGAAVFWRTESQIGVVQTSIGYEQKLNEERAKLTAAQIEISTLRSASMMLSAEVTRCNAQLKGQ